MTKIYFRPRHSQVVSRWLPTTAARGSKPDLGMWDLWWDKVALGRFSLSTSVSPAIVVRSTKSPSYIIRGKCTIGQCVAAVLGLIRT
jgi:hypothetical protein